MTVRTCAQRLPGQCLVTVAVISRRIGRCRRRHSEQLSAALKLARTMAVAEEPVVADGVKPIRQHVNQEAADELATIQGHDLLAIAIPVIPPAELDLAVVDGHQPVVGNGDAMGVPPDIVENLGRPSEGPLRIDHPLSVVNRGQVTPERGEFVEVTVCGEEVQLTGVTVKAFSR